MAACNLSRLIEEASVRNVKSKDSAGPRTQTQKMLADVWQVVDKYAASCLERKRGVVLPNFCRIGWQVVRIRGRTTHRPYFALLEGFCRSYNAKNTFSSSAADAEECPTEEFSFSKAAIRFSSQLTKDHVFTGLKALVQQIGEAVSQGRPLSLELSFGRLSAQEREVRLAFAPELYQTHGLEAPTAEESAARSRRIAPAALAAAAEAASCDSAGMLCLKGMGAAAPRHLEGDTLSLIMEQSTATPTSGAQALASHVPRAPPSMPSARVNDRLRLQEQARDDALNRQICQLELQASEVLRDQAIWENQAFMSRASNEREKEEQREQKSQHAAFLKKQMAMKEQQRRVERQQAIKASPREAHRIGGVELESLQKRNMLTSTMQEECAGQLAALQVAPPRPPGDMSSRGTTPRPNALRQALDEQVHAKKQQKRALQDFERRLDTNLSEARTREAVVRREHEQAFRAQEREVLTAAWREEQKMRDIKRNIEAIGSGRRPPPSSYAGSAHGRVGSLESGPLLSPSGVPPLSARGPALGAAASMALASPRAVAAA